MTVVPSSMGSRLRAAREIRGLSLSGVSESIKIPVSLLEALERDDLARWPKGQLYRRAFFRSYLDAIGLPAEPYTSEFARLFPDDGDAAPPAAVVAPRPRRASVTVAWRAGLAKRAAAARVAAVSARSAVASARAATGRWRTDTERWRAGAPSFVGALVEVALVVAAGALVAWVMDAVLLAGIGAVAIVFYPVTRTASGRARAVVPALQRSGRAVARAAGVARRNAGHAVAGVNYSFWCAVRAAAGYAQGLAARNLSRMREGA